MPLRRLRITILATGLALALPAVADAATRCVPNNSIAGDCTGGPYPQPQDAANGANPGDTIRIGPGTFLGVDTAKVLHFRGAGGGSLASSAGATILQPAGNTPALRLTGGGSIRQLRALGGSGTGSNSGGHGIFFFPAGAGDFPLTVEDVVAIGGNATTGTPGNGLQVQRSNTAVAQVSVGRGEFAGGTSDDSAATGLSFSASDAEITVNGVYAQGSTTTAGVGMAVNSAARATIDQSVFRGDAAVQVDAGAATIRRSTLTGRTFGISVFLGTNRPANATLENSLVTADLPGGGVAASAVRLSASDNSTVSFTARNSTLVAKGAARAAVDARNSDPGTNPDPTATLHNSIARLESPADPSNSADLSAADSQISADYSAFNTRRTAGSGNAPAPGSGTNVTGDPLFTNSGAGDFTLQPGSPLIDRGSNALVAGGLDLAGNTRVSGAAPDIGAFELQQAPPPGGTAGVNAVPTVFSFGATNRVFAPVARGGRITAAQNRKRRKRRVKRGTRFRYRLSEAGQVSITIERRLKGKRIRRGGKRRCVKPTRGNRKRRRCNRYKRAGTVRASGKAGANSTPFTGRFRGKALKRGRYRATLVVTDAQGARSRPRRLSFRIVKP